MNIKKMLPWIALAAVALVVILLLIPGTPGEDGSGSAASTGGTQPSQTAASQENDQTATGDSQIPDASAGADPTEGQGGTEHTAASKPSDTSEDPTSSAGSAENNASTEPTNDTKASNPTEPVNTAKPEDPTEPVNTTEPEDPTEPSVQQPVSDDPLDENYDITTLTYEAYIAMDGHRQEAVVNAFSTYDDFVRWYQAAEAAYKAAHPDIEVGDDGVIDGSDIGK